MSIHNLIIGGSEVFENLNKSFKCSDGFCSKTDLELKKLYLKDHLIKSL